MAEKIDLAERIRRMAELFDEEHIARALEVPVEVVRGVLEGTVGEETLQDFDPRRTDVRLVERERFVRSRVVGVVSMGGCGGTTLTAALALRSAVSDVRAVAVDLNEFASLGPVLGIDAWGEEAAAYPNFLWWTGNVEDVAVEHPDVPNLHLVLGAATAERHAEFDFAGAGEVVRACARSFGAVYVDCPASPRLWPHVLPECDFVLVPVRADASSVRSLWQMLPVLRACAVVERCAVVVTFAGKEGGLSENECRRLIGRMFGLSVLGVLPEDPAVRAEDLRALRKGSYASVVDRLFAEILPGNRDGNREKKSRGFLAAIFGR